MASPLTAKLLALSLLLIILSLPQAVTATASATVPENELQSMLTALRRGDHNLFANAVATSDILYQVLTIGTSFTFFVPTDSSLFALDMTASASDYLMTLRHHVVPRRISVSDLRIVPSGTALPTLLPHHQIRLARRRHIAAEILTVDGVEIADPGFFLSRHIAVHCLDGILTLRSHVGLRRPTSPPANSSIGHWNSQAAASDRGRSELLSNQAMDNHTVAEFSPASSPETPNFKIGISPAHSSSPVISPSLVISSPSIGEGIEGLPQMNPELTTTQIDEVSMLVFGGDKKESEVLKAFPAQITVAPRPVTEDIFLESVEESWPLDSETVDCPAQGGEMLGHVINESVDPNTLLHYTVSDQTCPRI